MAAGAKLRESEEHQGGTRTAADYYQRGAVEPVVVIVEARPGDVRGETDPLKLVLAVEPQGPGTFRDHGIAGMVRELVEELLWAGI
jgi:hypothetical protein